MIAAGLSLGDLLRHFHDGALGERRFTQTFVAALFAAALGLAILARRSVESTPRVVVIRGAGIIVIALGLWFALRPVDMGSYEPNCLPPVIEGTADERCSDVPRAVAGLALVCGSALALGLAARPREPRPRHRNADTRTH